MKEIRLLVLEIMSRRSTGQAIVVGDVSAFDLDDTEGHCGYINGDQNQSVMFMPRGASSLSLVRTMGGRIRTIADGLSTTSLATSAPIIQPVENRIDLIFRPTIPEAIKAPFNVTPIPSEPLLRREVVVRPLFEVLSELPDVTRWITQQRAFWEKAGMGAKFDADRMLGVDLRPSPGMVFPVAAENGDGWKYGVIRLESVRGESYHADLMTWGDWPDVRSGLTVFRRLSWIDGTQERTEIKPVFQLG